MSIERTIALACLVGASTFVAGCSALGLGDYDLLACDPDDPNACSTLNDDLPPDACPRYWCHPAGGCVDDVTSERCDGIDNDCDRAIDEDIAPSQDDDTFAVIDGNVENISYVAAANGVVNVVVTHTAPDDDNDYDHTLLTLAGDGEPQAQPFVLGQCMGANAEDDCSVKDLALAEANTLLVGAGFHRRPCRSGQLRVAAGSVAPFDLSMGEGELRDHSALLIDVDETSARPCTFSTACEGGDAPAVALLPAIRGELATALIVWRAKQGADLEACLESDVFSVAAIAVPVRDEEEPHIAAPSESESKLLEGNAVGPAQVVAVVDSSSSGFIVAFPSEDEIRLMFIARSAPAEPLRVGPVARIHAPGASHVALSAAPSGTGGLAVAYRTMRGRQTDLQLAILAVESDNRVVSGAPQALVEQGDIEAGPSLTYSPTGFATPGGGRPTGGWLVTWTERTDDPESQQWMASRVAEVKRSEPGRPVVLARHALRPFTYLKQDGEAHAMHGGFVRGDALHAVKLSCGR